MGRFVWRGGERSGRGGPGLWWSQWLRPPFVASTPMNKIDFKIMKHVVRWMEMFSWNRFIDVTSFHPLQESQRLFSMKSPWGQSADILTLSIFDIIILNYYKILFCHLSLVAGLIKKLSFLCRLLQNKIPTHWTELNSIHKCVLIYEHICRKLVSSLLNDIMIFLFCF